MFLTVTRSTTYLSLILVLIVISGCSSELFRSDIDWKRDENGDVYLLDTQKNWNRWVTLINLGIREEMKGAPSPGGMPSWDKRWISSIEELEKGRQENYQKYINYIIQTRREVGLPPLSYEKSRSE